MSAVFKLMVLFTTIFIKITEPVQERGAEVISTAAMTTPMVEEDVMLRTMEHYVSQGNMRLHIRNQQALTKVAQVQTPPRKLFFPDTFATAQTLKAGGIRKTLNSSPGWWCNRVNLPLDRSWLCSFVRVNLTANLAHTTREEDHRETIRACG